MLDTPLLPENWQILLPQLSYDVQEMEGVKNPADDYCAFIIRG